MLVMFQFFCTTRRVSYMFYVEPVASSLYSFFFDLEEIAVCTKKNYGAMAYKICRKARKAWHIHEYKQLNAERRM